jgi:hypothetical protein
MHKHPQWIPPPESVVPQLSLIFFGSRAHLVNRRRSCGCVQSRATTASRVPMLLLRHQVPEFPGAWGDISSHRKGVYANAPIYKNNGWGNHYVRPPLSATKVAEQTAAGFSYSLSVDRILLVIAVARPSFKEKLLGRMRKHTPELT